MGSTHWGECLLALPVALFPHMRSHRDRGTHLLGENEVTGGERLVDDDPALKVVLVVKINHTILLGEFALHRAV